MRYTRHVTEATGKMVKTISLSFRNSLEQPSVKRCSRCKQTKSINDFGKDASRENGKHHHCKECLNKYRKLFWANATKEQLASKKRAQVKYAHSQKAQEKARQRNEKKNYSLLTNFSNSKSRAKRVGLTWTISKELYQDLRSKPCEYCGGSLPKSSTGLDRKDNSRGYEPDNVVPSCSTCNYSRRTHFSYEEMKTFIGPAIRKIQEQRLKAFAQ